MLRGGRPIPRVCAKTIPHKMIFINFSSGQRPSPGELWEVEHGPRGGDELNLIETGKNYGWPVVSYGKNSNEAPIPSHDTRPDLAKPVLYWVPVIAPGNLMFYRGAQTFPQWDGSSYVESPLPEPWYIPGRVLASPDHRAPDRRLHRRGGLRFREAVS